MKVILTTLNAKYTHTSLALRYLRAYCQPLSKCDIVVQEYSINQQLMEITGQIYEQQPDVIGFGCYIWNIEMTQHLIAILKKILPEVKIICGGPEVSYDSASFLQTHPAVDFIVRGEGEETLFRLLTALSSGDQLDEFVGLAYRRNGQIIEGMVGIIDRLDAIPFPYAAADMAEVGDKIIYYESSRGCPFSCRYCLSSATKGVRFFSLERVLKDLQFFINHNVRQVKFVDRTFNIRKDHFLAIWRFLAKADCRTNFHFEIAADLLDEEALNVLAMMPSGRVQLEIGVQSTYEPTLVAIDRKNDWDKIAYSVDKVLSFGTIHMHLDLIVGLPKESYIQFKQSFNDVWRLHPHMLQIGFLKRLKGSGIAADAERQGYVFMDIAPYQVLQNEWLSYGEIRKLQMFEDVFEQFYNSGRFRCTGDFLIEKLQGDAFLFYERLTEYWLKKQLHTAAQSAKSLYVHQIDFCQINFAADMQYIKQFLKFDALISDSGVILPDVLPWSEREYYDEMTMFWRSDNVVKYLPDFQFSTWREVKKRYHIEVFSVSITAWLERRELVEKQEAILFSGGEHGAVWQVIVATDFFRIGESSDGI